MITAGLSAWAASNPRKIPIHMGDNIHFNNPEVVEEGIHRSVAAFQTVVAITSCHQQGKQFVAHANPALSSIENMLVMMGRTDRHGKPEPKTAFLLSKIWI